MVRLEYHCDDKGPLFPNNETECKITKVPANRRETPKFLGIATAVVTSEEVFQDEPMQIMIEIKPEQELEDSLEELGISEDDFESEMISQFQPVIAEIGEKLPNEIGEFEVD